MSRLLAGGMGVAVHLATLGAAVRPHPAFARLRPLRTPLRPRPERDVHHLTQLSRLALLVAAGDLLTKATAQTMLAHEPTFFWNWLQFAVVHNESGAFGWSVGVYTWQLNLAITLAAIVFVVPVSRDLARVDASSPIALGLIAGGALGNLASLISSPRGVVDFIVVHYSPSGGVALNVADVAAYVGLAMILRTGALIVTAIRRKPDIVEPFEREIVISLFAEKSEVKRGLRRAQLQLRDRAP